MRGDFDVASNLGDTVNPAQLPLSKVVQHGSLRIGFTHGHTILPPGDADSLLIAARQMDVDVLLWGGTGRFEAYEMEGKFFVNPGSATGAITWGWEKEDPVPSFVLMDVSFWMGFVFIRLSAWGGGFFLDRVQGRRGSLVAFLLTRFFCRCKVTSSCYTSTN